jgi:hypothetical protein
LYLLESPYSPSPKATLLHEFTSIDGVGGIAEIRPDTFVVIGGNLTESGNGIAGTFEAWEVILPSEGNQPSLVRKIADIPDAVYLNGAAPLLPANFNNYDHGSIDTSVVLMSDSTLGAVFRLDVDSGRSEVVFRDPVMAPIPGQTFGINGIKIRHGYLYFDNSLTLDIYRLPLTANGYAVPGGPAAQLVATVNGTGAPFVDDFTFGSDGAIWACTNLGDTIVLFKPVEGTHGSAFEPPVVVVGAETQLTVAGATAAVFGTGKDDPYTLYVTTSGALAAPVNGTVIEPAKVVAVDTRKCA